MAKKGEVKETEKTTEGLTCSEVAEKMNTVLGLQGEDIIDTTLEDDDMKVDILKAAGLVGMDPKTDKYSQKLADKDKADLGDDIWAWLETNEMLGHIPKPEPEKPKAGKPAKEKPAKAEKPAGEKKKGGFAPNPEAAKRKEYLAELISANKYTKAQIVEKAQKKFPDFKASTIITTLTDAKNPKYNKFVKLAKVDADGIFSF